MWYKYKIKHVDQWNTVENPNMTTQRYSHSIFDKEAKEKMHLRKGSIWMNGFGKAGCPHAEDWKWIHLYHPVHIIAK